MAKNTVWIKTQKAVNDFFQVLTCKKCKGKLTNPRHFLICGHLACAECVGTDTVCTQCKIPGKASDVYSDRVINDILFNLNIIAEAAKLPQQNSKINYTLKPPLSDKNNEGIREKSTRKINVKTIIKNKVINETLNTSICESFISQSTQRGKSNEIIPKNIDKKNNKGETALHIACRSNNVNRVKLLIEAGANVNTKDNAGWTPLQEAASYGYCEVCEMLLKAGALPNTYGFGSKTALHEAVMIDDCQLVSLLFIYNANRKVLDNNGKKPEDYCKSKEMTDIFKNLQESTVCQSETVSETSQISVFEKSINTTNNSKIVLYGSNLKPKNHKLLSKLGIDRKLRVAQSLSTSVTHVIVDTDATGNVRLTLDLLITILSGKILLSSDCFLVHINSENITAYDLSSFELNSSTIDGGLIRARENVQKENPKLFDNCNFYFAIKNYNTIRYDNMNITKKELMKLVAVGGGITLTREPKPEDIQGSLSPFHVSHNPKHSLHKCTHYVIYNLDDSNSNLSFSRIMYNTPTLKTLPLLWFIESALRYKLLDPIDLGLFPE